MMRWLLTLVAMCVVVTPAWGQDAEVDRAEVLRLGNMVQHIDLRGIGSEQVDAFVEAMGPPASDADKWFISVVTMQGCTACVQLKSEWTTSPWLLALADPGDPKKSWAHYNVYAREDQSQAFRFRNLQIDAYPTILVQPPRSGRFGDPKTVVFQGTYGGDPEKLARQITDAIRQYVAQLEASQPPRPPQPPQQPAHRAAEETTGFDPPWLPVPKIDPPLPHLSLVFPDGRPLIPPNLNPPDLLLPTLFRWGTAGTVLVTAVLTLLLSWGVPRALQAFRQWRIASGQRTLLTDQQFQQLLETLRAGRTPAPAEPPRGPTAP